MLRLEHVSVAVDTEDGKHPILNDINLEFERKKLYVITGPNGGGKSTLGKTLMGIHPVSSGSIVLDGENITDLDITNKAKKGIGYAFQTPARFKGLKVDELLDLASGKEAKDHCSLLFDVGLCAQDYLERDIDNTISGGELKRIEIASILAQNPKIAIFDEPEAGIDLWSFQRLTETFESLHKKTDTTIIIISHQERILRLADQVILVKDGVVDKITEQETFLNELQEMESGCACRTDCIRGGAIHAE